MKFSLVVQKNLTILMLKGIVDLNKKSQEDEAAFLDASENIAASREGINNLI